MYKTTQHKVAFAGIMAAFMAVAGFFPAIPLFGLGKVISFGEVIMPLIGILLGPLVGGYAALVGALIGETIAPYGAVFGFLTFIPPTLGALNAGLLSHKKWKLSFLLLGSLVVLWYTTDVGAELYYFPYLHIIALFMIAIFGRKLSDLDKNLFPKFFIISFCAVLTDHMAGNLIFILLYSPAKAAFSAILVQYSFERTLMALFSAIIGTGVLKILKEVNIWTIEK